MFPSASAICIIQIRGPGYTQNRGIRAARAPVVLLMADDIFMMPGTLSAHLRGHEVHPESAAALLGNVRQSPALDQSVFLRTWNSFRFSDFESLVEVPYYRFWACNISVKRDFLLENGLFRETKGRAGPAAHEDPELGYRLYQAGLRIFYDTKALGYHHHVVTRERRVRVLMNRDLTSTNSVRWPRRPKLRLPTMIYGGELFETTFASGLEAAGAPLAKGDRNPVLAISRYVLRGMAFNRVTVRVIWNPIFDLAEKSSRVARLMRPVLYRGLIAHNFLRGCRDGNRRFGAPRIQQTQQA